MSNVPGKMICLVLTKREQNLILNSGGNEALDALLDSSCTQSVIFSHVVLPLA